MSFKKSLVLAGVSLGIASVASAQTASVKMLDVVAGAGYTSINGSDVGDDGFNGWNVTAGVLAPLAIGSPMVTPTVGAGLKYFDTRKSEDGADAKLQSLSLQLNGGAKFNVAPRFTLMALANFGYGLSDKYEHGNHSVTPKEHMNYGAAVGAGYDFVDSLNVGVSALYNWHSMKHDDKSARFEELSVNLTATYSI